MMLSGLYNKSKEKVKSSCQDDNEESNELDYNEDRDQLEGRARARAWRANGRNIIIFDRFSEPIQFAKIKQQHSQ